MKQIAVLPNEGYVRIEQIIGQDEVTPEEAACNCLDAEAAKKAGKIHTKPRRPRPGIQGVFPCGRTHWYEGVNSGDYPAPIKRGRMSLWAVSDIRRLLADTGKQVTEEQTTAAA